MGPWGQQCLQTRAGIQGTRSLPELLVQRVPELLGWWGSWSSQDGDRETRESPGGRSGPQACHTKVTLGE